MLFLLMPISVKNLLFHTFILVFIRCLNLSWIGFYVRIYHSKMIWCSCILHQIKNSFNNYEKTNFISVVWFVNFIFKICMKAIDFSSINIWSVSSVWRVVVVRTVCIMLVGIILSSFLSFSITTTFVRLLYTDWQRQCDLS